MKNLNYVEPKGYINSDMQKILDRKPKPKTTTKAKATPKKK